MLSSESIRLNIERLLHYGLTHELLDQLDIIQIRNSLLDLFKLDEPCSETVEFTVPDSLYPILNQLIDAGLERGLFPDNTITYRDLFGTRIMGLLTPRQSEVVRRFRELEKNQSIQEATKFFYAFSKVTNYIRMDRIQKNISWKALTEFGELEISINLSKPEKDPKEIAKNRHIKAIQYPKCVLCLENVGYAGNEKKPARQNHRVIPLILGGESWYFQYSPYSYYNEHCILFSAEHKPMNINRTALIRMLDFIKQYPHYFIGANAGLPIVGGSILSHDHYQGGRQRFPIQDAKVLQEFTCHQYPEIKISTHNWCMSFIRLTGEDEERLLDLATYILDQWNEYTDKSANIIAVSEERGEQIRHNAITPIIRKNAEGLIEIDLVLRNNRTSVEYPDGIFHPHQNLHHIKKENIGIIEVMGLAILPGRLEKELGFIRRILSGESDGSDSEILNPDHLLHKHLTWIYDLVNNYGIGHSIDQADHILKKEVALKYQAVLMDASVFKTDSQGYEAFSRFLNHCGFRILKDRRGLLR